MSLINTLLLDGAAQQGSSMMSLLMIVAMIVIFYFFMIRPQKKRQKEIKMQQEAMKSGDRVVTQGGIHGRVREVKDNTVSIEIAPNVTIKVEKNYVFPVADEAPAKK